MRLLSSDYQCWNKVCCVHHKRRDALTWLRNNSYMKRWVASDWDATDEGKDAFWIEDEHLATEFALRFA